MALDMTMATYAIAAMAIVYTLLSTFITKTVGNPKRIKEIQENFNQIKKDLDKAMKEKNDKGIDEAVKRQEAAMPTMMEMMILMYKPLIAIIPLLIIFANPQLNFNDQYVFPWPSGAADAASVNMSYAAPMLGLPQGTRLEYANNTSLRFIGENGSAVAHLEHLDNGRLSFSQNGGNSFFASLHNEEGRQLVYFPSMRLVNPLAVQNSFRGFVIKLPISLPIFIQNFDRFPNWRDTFGPNGWFWICVILSGFGISIINSINEKKVEKKASEPATSAPAKP